MTTNKLFLVAFVIFQIEVSKCQIIKQSTCDVSGSDGIESCGKHNALRKENEPDSLLYRKIDQIHQSWHSSLYLSAGTVGKDVGNRLPRYSEPLGVKETSYSKDNQAENIDSSKEMIVTELFYEALKRDGEKVKGVDKEEFEYPPVYRHNPGKVGDFRYIKLEDGVKTKLITRAVRPPLFEIPNFLSDEECEYMIKKSLEKGLYVSKTFKSKANTDTGINVSVERRSFSSFLRIQDVDEAFMSRLHDRVSVLIGMQKQVVQWSENLAIGMYEPGGYYYAHLDSNEESGDIPCCFQTKCIDSAGNDREDCCRVCRYVTVLYYLNDVEEGGETAFPFADLSFQEIIKINNERKWQNLTSHCHDSNVVIKPEKGKAIMWYNHFVDGNGYISALDQHTYHGGCEVIKGTKWIATNWISTPNYSQRFQPSKYRDII